MNLIAAICKNNGIGVDNGLLCHIPEDMRFFKEMTIGKTVVMGYNTLLSLPGGRPLPKRQNIVLSSKHKVEGDLIVCESLEVLFESLRLVEDEDIFVIGGEAVYNLLAPYCRYAYITEINADFKATKFFSLSNDWDKIKEGEWKSFDGLAFRFCEYANRNNKKWRELK